MRFRIVAKTYAARGSFTTPLKGMGLSQLGETVPMVDMPMLSIFALIPKMEVK